jgi:hypothetical protein
VEKAVAPILAQQRTFVRADGAAQRQAQHLIGARRLVDELYRATDGQLRQMRSLQLIAERARADAKAVYHAVEARWVEVSPENDPHSIVLTDAGRRLAA